MTRLACTSLVALLLAASVVAAQTPATAPAAPGEKMQVTVVRVTGVAEKMLAGEGGKWTPLAAGEKLDELTIIRTGLRGSEVVLKFADRGETVIRAASKVGIAEYTKKGNLVTTHLGLKYGRAKFAVDSTRGPNDVKVTTPAATLSIRGSEAVIGVAGTRTVLTGNHGNLHLASGTRGRNVVAGESTDGNLTPSTLLAQVGRDDGMVPLGMTPKEGLEIISNRRPTDPTGTGDSRPPILPIPVSPIPGKHDHIILGI